MDARLFITILHLALTARCTAAVEYLVVGGLGANSGLQVLALDSTTGALSQVSGSATAGPAPSFVTWHPAARVVRQLLVTNEDYSSPSSGLAVVRWEATGGGAPRIGAAVGRAQVPTPAHVVVAPSGRWVLTAGYAAGTVSLIPVDPQSGQSALGTPREWPAGKGAHQVVLGPGGRFAYVPCLGADWVRAFAFDDASGALTPLTGPGGAGAGVGNRSLLAMSPGSGPRHLVLHPSLPVAYVINELSNTVARLDWDKTTGLLSGDVAAQPQRVVSTLPPGTPRGCPISAAATGCAVQAAAELVLSADGRFLYASNRGGQGGHSSIAVFEVAPTDGALRAVGWELSGGALAFPRHISLTPGDAFLLVANQHSDTAMAFRRDAGTGQLRKASTLSTAGVVAQPSFVAVVG